MWGVDSRANIMLRPGKTSAWRRTGIDLAYQIFLWETRKLLENSDAAVNGTYRSTNQTLALLTIWGSRAT
jgi:hypothetical protein